MCVAPYSVHFCGGRQTGLSRSYESTGPRLAIVSNVGRSPSLRIVDFSTHMSGPLASQLLMQLGADVIKVENPRLGDGNRRLEPLINGYGLFHIALNSGARSLAIDRHSVHWDRVVAACVRRADAVIVGSRPVDAARRGLDFATLLKINPEIVYCSISGYGQKGPWRDRTAHGLNPDVCAGIVPIQLEAGQPGPHAAYQSIGAPLAGVFAALGILAALRERDSGTGARYVNTSLWESAMWFSWRHTTAQANLGQPWLAYREMGSRYSIYQTSDDKAILVCPIEQRFWEAFCDLVGLPNEWKVQGDWGTSGMDNGFGRDYERLSIAEAIARRPLADWVRALEQADVPFAPVLTIAEALRTDQAAANGLMRETRINGAPALIPTIPVAIGRSPGSSRDHAAIAEPPTLGQHTAEILAELGLDLPVEELVR
jgi:crotonobetainyl-CoA:carnitine CoA-transferase CaiB-like acyl-CoA transferase